MDNNYKVRLKCDNCGKYTEVEIPWEIKVEEYLKGNPDKACPNCGCRSFGRQWISAED